jgi:hypothetical protein
LWFVTLHPFDDGNGRIARAAGSPQRFCGLPAQIQRDRKAYYDILEWTRKGTLDVPVCLPWFLATLHHAVDQAQHTLDAVVGRPLSRSSNSCSTTPPVLRPRFHSPDEEWNPPALPTSRTGYS